MLPDTVKVEDGDGDNFTTADLTRLMKPPDPTAFETRNVGSTLEIEPNVGANERIVDLRFAPEVVTHTGNISWLEMKDLVGNKHEILMPAFYSNRISTGLTMYDGQYSFAGLLTPKGEDGEPDFDKKRKTPGGGCDVGE